MAPDTAPRPGGDRRAPDAGLAEGAHRCLEGLLPASAPMGASLAEGKTGRAVWSSGVGGGRRHRSAGGAGPRRARAAHRSSLTASAMERIDGAGARPGADGLAWWGGAPGEASMLASLGVSPLKPPDHQDERSTARPPRGRSAPPQPGKAAPPPPCTAPAPRPGTAHVHMGAAAARSRGGRCPRANGTRPPSAPQGPQAESDLTPRTAGAPSSGDQSSPAHPPAPLSGGLRNEPWRSRASRCPGR